MPTTPARARKWIKSGRATPFWKKGLFCVRLNVEPSSREIQDVAVGIDPGSKKEAFTVKSELHTYVSIQTDAVTWVKDKLESRRNLRRGRRFRKTPCRQNKMNRSRGGIPPSTKARWGLKLRISEWLWRICPVSCFVVEDVKAKTIKGARRWNVNFSPLEVGKRWFYEELRKLARVELREGWQTAEYRTAFGFPKLKNKMSNEFLAHRIDSWVLANDWVGGHTEVDNFHSIILSPINLYRRQLHVMNFAKGGIRKTYGSTRSLGFKRGSLVRHTKFGLTMIGGTTKGRVSLREVCYGKRLCQNAKVGNIKFLSYYPWNYYHYP